MTHRHLLYGARVGGGGPHARRGTGLRRYTPEPAGRMFWLTRNVLSGS
jgi:hypothetical protein